MSNAKFSKQSYQQHQARVTSFPSAKHTERKRLLERLDPQLQATAQKGKTNRTAPQCRNQALGILHRGKFRKPDMPTSGSINRQGCTLPLATWSDHPDSRPTNRHGKGRPPKSVQQATNRSS
jgi:hypothetical protein